MRLYAKVACKCIKIEFRALLPQSSGICAMDGRRDGWLVVHFFDTTKEPRNDFIKTFGHF